MPETRADCRCQADQARANDQTTTMTRLLTLPKALIRASALAALTLVGLPTQAQYQWRDANGSMVFSDRPPPPGASVRIVKAPPAPAPVAAAMPKAPASAAPAEKVAVTPGTDRTLTDKLKQNEKADKADKAKAAAENEQIAKDQARQCEGLRENSRVLQSGERMTRLNKAGEREYLSDADKQARLQDNTRDLAKYCK
jgi:Domain of unknown function (DUF4124)